MQVQMAGRELGELGEAAGERDPRDRVAAQIFEHAADEIAHVDQRELGQAVERLDRALRGRAGGGGDVAEAGGARDVDAAVDGMHPGRAGIGDHDPGRAEDREAADDAEPAVGGPPRQDLAARDRDRDLEVAGIALVARDRLDQRRGSAGAAPGLIAGSPTGTGSPGRVTTPTPSPAMNMHARCPARRGGRSPGSGRRG